MQDKAEAKLRQLEARAEEQVRARAQADEEWRKQQRERELERLKVSAHAWAHMASFKRSIPSDVIVWQPPMPVTCCQEEHRHG